MELTTLKKEMTKVIELVKKNTDIDNLSNQEIEHLINYAMYEILYLPKKSATNRMITSSDDRPCDTEAPDNVIKVNFK
mgnify:FL=1|tara:strand:- start:153 stop:386 length:234 start_codon:yes stop_codon:yes gene_type:complete